MRFSFHQSILCFDFVAIFNGNLSIENKKVGSEPTFVLKVFIMYLEYNTAVMGEQK